MAVRDMREEDLPEVYAIEAASFGLPWTHEMLRDELGHRFGWREVVLDGEGRAAGFVIARRFPFEWHLLDLAVAPRRRRQGLARRLVTRLLRAADAAGEAGALGGAPRQRRGGGPL